MTNFMRLNNRGLVKYLTCTDKQYRDFFVYHRGVEPIVSRCSEGRFVFVQTSRRSLGLQCSIPIILYQWKTRWLSVVGKDTRWRRPVDTQHERWESCCRRWFLSGMPRYRTTAGEVAREHPRTRKILLSQSRPSNSQSFANDSRLSRSGQLRRRRLTRSDKATEAYANEWWLRMSHDRVIVGGNSINLKMLNFKCQHVYGIR